MTVSPQNPVVTAAAIYNVERWGEGYFGVDGDGHVTVSPNGSVAAGTARLDDVLRACREAGLRSPVLVRFDGILRHRVQMLAGAFREAIAAQGYQGGYIPVYPIKVNQQRRVVHEILRARELGERVGLEAGSKPELLAVLAHSGEAGNTIVCNGYKDREYVRLALMGEKLGFRVHIVVEKLSELPLILAEAKALGVTPRLGLRVRLMSIGKGNWQNTGGEKSKFGLSASQLVEAVERCREAGYLASVRMLHFHLGSQVANLQDIKAGMREAARYYQELRALGAPVDTLDVGGGLGVDYEGTRSRSACSMNYGLADYAWHIVQTVREFSDRAELPQPDIISESGRALTAHHAVLLVNIIDREQLREVNVAPPSGDAAEEVATLWQLQQTLRGPRTYLLETHQDVLAAWQDVQQRFLLGEMSLTERATAEKLYINCLLAIRAQLDPQRKHQRALRDELSEILADKLFVNFSVFQSVPDVWGIGQIFPILPLSGLQNPLTARAVVQDITCDSDGRIDQYVDGEGLENTLPLPENAGDELGIFMVGAYQEILGDMHNLFGDTDAVDVDIDADGNIHLDEAIQGDTVSSVLRYVNYEPEALLETLAAHCQRAALSDAERQTFMTDIREGLAGYTYLEE
ncbi:biosynthetic arginine decarboxylase [Alcanivorax quisquiliarum]|uniref:Arginine decarboxylase n=1 Tax=Alcanivorax quisquiliarum TaxID=2933565 RepID=A0ABT0E8Q2_9GAMM|nr:biosynthetic arginine decarboxylase [Alcanivorax quisquiliarum]MCK0538127.1 biosynthetic arginine decarboxylase [Alcanivorax quisquiliarum]